MPEELRVAFHRDLDLIEERVARLFALVAEGLAAANDALLSGDRSAARALAAKDAEIDELYKEVEQLVQREFALQAPMARLAGGASNLIAGLARAVDALRAQREGAES